MLDVSIYTQQLYENRILFTLFNSPLDSLFVNREQIKHVIYLKMNNFLVELKFYDLNGLDRYGLASYYFSNSFD